MIDHDHIKDLLPAYALGCLDEDEAVIVGDHLVSCEQCRLHLETYRPSVDLLVHGTPSAVPPDNIKTELMRRVESTPDAQAKPKFTEPSRSQASVWYRFAPVWAIAGLIVIVGLGVANLVQWRSSTRSFHTGASAELLIIKMKGTTRAPEGDGTFVISRDRKQGQCHQAQANQKRLSIHRQQNLQVFELDDQLDQTNKGMWGNRRDASVWAIKVSVVR